MMRVGTFENAGRVIVPEILGSAANGAVRKNLCDLTRINRWFGGYRTLGAVVDRVVGRDEEFSLLDVGAGSGDMGAAILARYRRARVVSLDRQPSHVYDAPGSRVVANALRLPFHRRAFDVVLCSLLLHEFADREAVDLLARLHRVTRRALIVLELHRHPLAYHFLPATRWMFGWGEVTVHDGPVSVQAAFQPHELERLARCAGLKDVEVQRHPPWFRLSMVARS